MSALRRSWGLRRYLVAGVLVWLPIFATVWVIKFLIDLTDRILYLLPEQYRPQALLGFPLPGLGIVLALVVLFVTGVLVTNFLGRRLVAYWERLLKRIPLVRSVYGGVKSFTESVFSQKNTFRRVVMVEYPRQGTWNIGFVTAEDVAEVSARTGKPHLCVYVPTAPNPTSGLMIMVPREHVVELEMTVDQAMRMIITCGVVVPPAPIPAPAPRALDAPRAGERAG
jgi:uncharacterized membrane protein